MLRKILLFTFLFHGLAFAQTMTFDEFLKFSNGILKHEELKKCKDFFPKRFVITSADFGDFSGDNITDFAIAVRPLGVKGKKIFTFLFCDSANAYVPILSDTLEFYELPIEIAFNISDNICFITQKVKEKSWNFTGYSFLNNELSIVDLYSTGSNQFNKKSVIGTENYTNYKNLNSFSGFFDLNNLKEYKKTYFFVHPVYNVKRNIYPGFKKDIEINNDWFWSDSVKNQKKFGNLCITRKNGFLHINTSLIHSFESLLDPASAIEMNIYFDRSQQKLNTASTKRNPVFRDSLDDDIAWVSIAFNDSTIINHDLKFGKNFNLLSISNTDYKISSIDNVNLIIKIPENIFNLETLNEIGLFLSIEAKLKDGENIILKNSSGTFDDPSSYGKMIFLNENEYYGSVQNNKFKQLVEKLTNNGLNTQIINMRF